MVSILKFRIMTAPTYKSGLGHQFKAEQKAIEACSSKIESAMVSLTEALGHLPYSAECIHMKVMICNAISSAKDAHKESVSLSHSAIEAYNQND
jgi:hypothetical protein